MSDNTHLETLQRSRTNMTRLASVGGVSLALLAFASIFVIQLNGAVLTNGHVIPQGENIVLQHTDGGLVKDIFFEDGDRIDAGENILNFDGSELRGELNRLKDLHLELTVRIASTRAALEGKSNFVLPVEEDASNTKASLRGRDRKSSRAPLLRSRSRSTPESQPAVFRVQNASLDTAAENKPSKVSDVVGRQRLALQADRAFFTSRIKQIQERIASSSDNLVIQNAQMRLLHQRAQLIDTEITELSALVNDQLLPRGRLSSLQREKLDIQQRAESLLLEDTQLRGQIALARKELATLQAEDANRLWTQLQTDEQELANILYNIKTVEAQIERLNLLAPVGGRIHELSVKNPGTVVQAGEVILQIVPFEKKSEVSVQIDLTSIDDVEVGQRARLRFDTFKAHAATELIGRVLYISPDRSIDPVTGLPFYAARIGLDDASLEDFRNIGPSNGAPVTVMIQTKQRSLASYLFEPVQQAMAKTFTET